MAGDRWREKVVRGKRMGEEDSRDCDWGPGLYAIASHWCVGGLGTMLRRDPSVILAHTPMGASVPSKPGEGPRAPSAKDPSA